MYGTVKRKRILRIACIASLLVLAITLLVENGRTRFEFTPKDWRFSWGDLMILYDEHSRPFGTRRESHIGPFVIEHYGPQKQFAEPNGAANGSQPIRSETNGTSGAAGSRR